MWERTHMIRRLGFAVLFFALGSVAALAADFNGKWTAEFNTQIGVQSTPTIFM